VALFAPKPASLSRTWLVAVGVPQLMVAVAIIEDCVTITIDSTAIRQFIDV
jgi:cell division inhibitor SulA